MKKYVIAGAGGLGREIFHSLKSYIAHNQLDAEIRGFIDDDLFALANYQNYPRIFDDIKEYIPRQGEVVVVAIGAPSTRKSVVEILHKKNVVFDMIIHPNSSIGQGVSLGEGIHLGWHVGVSCDVRIGNFTSLNGNITVGHDVVIDDYVEVGPGTSVSGFAHIEEGVHIGSGCVIAPGVRVGAWSKISANTAVLRDVPPCSFVSSQPPHVHRDFFAYPEPT